MAFGERRTPLKRKTEMKRGEGPKANPEKTRAWQRKSRKPLPQKSEQRVEDTPKRQALVADVLAHQPQCAAMIPYLCTGRSTEVNEIIRRSQWQEGFLVRSNTEGLCHACHAHITDNPGDTGWAMRHGHQLPGWVRDRGNNVYVQAVMLARRIRTRTSGHCQVSCPIDHRPEEEERSAHF